jgi:hypothetical protein
MKFNKFLTLGVATMATALTMSAPVQVETINHDSDYAWTQGQAKKVADNYANTMGGKLSDDPGGYFQYILDNMSEIQAMGKNSVCSPLATDLRDTYHKYLSNTTDLLMKNTGFDHMSKTVHKEFLGENEFVMQKELETGKTHQQIASTIASMRAKAFKLGDCMHLEKPAGLKK